MSISSRFLLVGAFLIGMSYCDVVRADPPASLIGSPIPEKNGFDSFLEAIRSYEGSLGNAGTLSSVDLLRAERAAVGRNRGALRKFREGLALPVLHPRVRNRDEAFGDYRDFRKLAELIEQESDVLFSDGNWNGALNSSLDCIEFGVLISRGGPLGAAQAGCDIEQLGRNNLTPALISRLTKDESLAAAARLARIESLRPPYPDALRVEKVTGLALTKESFEKSDWTDVVNETVKPDGKSFTESEKSILNNSGQDEIIANLSKVLDEAIAGAEAPYRPTKFNVGRAADPWSRMLTDAVTSSSYRIDYERGRAENPMIRAALLLRVHKIETGTYPETIELPFDPFTTDAKMKYRRAGDAYVLYSVGPNGKDDNGQPIVLGEGEGLTITTKGDLVAPVYS
jgi:hypothetical protein